MASPRSFSLLFTSEEILNIYRNINEKTNSIYSETQLSLEEESMMRSFYHLKIRDLCSALDFSLVVEAEAHWFLHNYFLRFGLLEHDTKHIMLACVFLAAKSCNIHLTMDEFVNKIPNTLPKAIIKSEIIILEASDFTFPTVSPVTCFYGFVFDFFPMSTVSDYDECIQKSLDRLQIALMIDQITLLYSPSKIALSCLLSSVETSATEGYWETRLGKLENVSELYSEVERINKVIDDFVEISPDMLRPIDRKIRLARSTSASTVQ